MKGEYKSILQPSQSPKKHQKYIRGGHNVQNPRKSLIQYCEQSEQKSLLKMPKIEACGQTVLPDRSILIRQKLVENTKIQIRHFV